MGEEEGREEGYTKGEAVETGMGQMREVEGRRRAKVRR